MPRLSLLLLLGAAGAWPASADADAKFGYDCEYGYDHWRAAWSDDQKTWCCSYVSRGCVGDQDKEAGFKCPLDNTMWLDAWSDVKKDWCCENSRPWSDAHQDFCCERDKGCHTDSTGKSYNCQADKATLSNWDHKEKKWCCKWEPPLGCDSLDRVAKKYACDVGIEDQWSDDQADWCCQHEEKGCRVHIVVPTYRPVQRIRITTDTPTFRTGDDCSGDINQQMQWSNDKICSCCSRYGIACPKVYYPPEVPPADAVICQSFAVARIGQNEIGFGKSTIFSKVSPAAGKWVAGGALGLVLGAAALVGVRRGITRASRPGQRASYSSMPQKDSASSAEMEAIQELEMPLEELS